MSNEDAILGKLINNFPIYLGEYARATIIFIQVGIKGIGI